MSVRLADIAKRANVSLGVVSAVVNRSRSNTVVSKETESRILSIAKELGYVPNLAARSVRRGRFNRIAGVVVQYGPKGTTYTPNSGYFDAAADSLAEAGYSLVFEPMHLLQFVDEFVDPPKLFKELGVDGVLGLPAAGTVPTILDEQLERMGCPVVWLNRKSEAQANWVHCDEVAGAMELTQHLIDLGHRRIGYFGFAGLHYSVVDRFAGYQAAMRNAGLDTSGVSLTEREASIVDEAERLLSHPAKFTAIVCFQRRGYDALLHVAASRGIRVPHDVSLCYFATSWEMLPTYFPSTTMCVPEPAMARAGVRILLDQIEGRSSDDVPRAFVGTLLQGLSTTAISPA